MKYILIFFIVILIVGMVFLMLGYQNYGQALDEKIPSTEEVRPKQIDIPLKTPSSEDIVEADPLAAYHEGNELIDEFDGEELNSLYWNKMDREKNYNNELQAYRPENAYVEDGFLYLTAQEQNGKYISGLVSTQNKIEFLYGSVEVRLKHPEGKSFFPAVWLLPTNNHSFPEIDIFEVVGHNPNTIYFVHHYYQNGQKEKSVGVAEIEDYSDFHIYRFEWTPNSLAWFLDGDMVHSTTVFVPDKPMYLIMNFAVGGIWPGDPNEETRFPSSVVIDYVRFIPFNTQNDQKEYKIE